MDNLVKMTIYVVDIRNNTEVWRARREFTGGLTAAAADSRAVDSDGLRRARNRVGQKLVARLDLVAASQMRVTWLGAMSTIGVIDTSGRR